MLHAHITRTVRNFAHERTDAIDKGRYSSGDAVRLRDTLEMSLERIRDEVEPHIRRPEALATACDRLRESHANVHRRSAASRLTARFQAELVRVQQPVATDFVDFCSALLLRME